MLADCGLLSTQACAVKEACQQAIPARLEETVAKFQACSDPKQRYQLVLQYAESLAPYPEELKRNENRVLGCSAQVGQTRWDMLVARPVDTV